MNQDMPLTADQMVTVLDSSPLAIYVMAMDNWELLYANHQARELLMWKAERRGMTCYQAAGFDKPCPYCQLGKMNSSRFLVREFRYPANGRIYQLSGKLIDWSGRAAHIEYILDITNRKQEEDSMRTLQEELQAAFRSIPCGLCVYRYDGKTIKPLSHNPAFYEIMGYSGEHIENIEQETSFLGVHQDDVAALKVRIGRVIQDGGIMRHTYRVWNDREQKYHWIRLDGSVKSQEDGTKLLYGVYSDVSGQQLLEEELTAANEKMQDIVNAIPGGVAIYKVTDIFETVYFSDGVPELSGYTVEEYRELIKRDAAEMTYWEDTPVVVGKAGEVIASRGGADFEFRKLHRDGHIVWVRAQVKWLGEEDGYPLLHCVFHNISDLKEAQLEMDHLINSIPGGIASYRVEAEQFIPVFFSDGVTSLSGHTREEYNEMCRFGINNIIYELDRERVLQAAKAAFLSGEVLDISYRMRHKNGNLIWIHLNGRRMGPLAENARFYAVFTGMSAEARLFQSIANETADGIYVIDKKNYDLLYNNESKELFISGSDCLGQKCYTALHGKSGPCEFCTLNSHKADGEEHEMAVEGTNRFYKTRFWETEWNGIPAYVKYVWDVTEEVNTRREKERLEMYFKTVVDKLPGGILVIRCEADGRMVPEFMSGGFAAMVGMTMEEAGILYQNDAFAGICPEDAGEIRQKLKDYVRNGEEQCEITGRMMCGDGTYIWVKCMLSLKRTVDGVSRLYASYTDITGSVEEKEQIRRQYEELILKHYRMPGPDALVVGHCNITQNRILEIIDHTDSYLLKNLGTVREEFFTGLAALVVDQEERQVFLDTYLNAPALAAFRRKDTEQILKCFVRFPREEKGRYVQFKVNLVEAPDTGDITGILTVTDITEQTISDRILHQLSVTNYDFVIDLNLDQDSYTILTSNQNAVCIPERKGCHSRRVAEMLASTIVPKDREQYRRCLDPAGMRQRLEREGLYTFAFSITDENGDIRTKNMTVTAIDLRLGRVCLLRTDITDSVREQQGLLNMMAYTFELMGIYHVGADSFIMYTRQMVLENLPPHVMDNYSGSVEAFAESYISDEGGGKATYEFMPETMLKRLEEEPSGYDFVFMHQSEEGLRYKQINVLWGDQNHKTICMVRADVTDMLAAERRTKKALEKALALAEEANRAKSDFLSAMSHDIRTPMNAIMGMTALAVAHMDDRARVADCLQKISISSRHLLSLINDILDMSKIERSKIMLNRMRISLPELLEQISAIMLPQARAAGLQFEIRMGEFIHPYFYGDSLRISQILINILSNAVKFTPEGGRVDFLAEEILPAEDQGKVRCRFTVRDTGIGMSKEFMEDMFAPFARSKGAARIEGTGLGLSITKGLVELMGGSISVESRQNEGSAFQVEIECEAADDKEDSAAEKPGAAEEAEGEKRFAGRCFLVAEDNAINAEILCELLLMQGAKTVVKTDGIQAVREFTETPPGTYDAVLMDIQMPEMNGYEATRRIRELDRPDARTIPIVAMTANAFSEDVQASIDAGMTAHVAKPIDVEMLGITLSRVLE